jgi:hypothetical protein
VAPDEDPRLLLLDPRDNVLVVRQRIRAGAMLAIDGTEVLAARDLPPAHKIAHRPLRPAIGSSNTARRSARRPPTSGWASTCTCTT